MTTLRTATLAILSATVWISGSEFLRNQVLLIHYWTNHYQQLGLTFATKPINGMLWGIWSLCFAVILYIIHLRFTLRQTMVLGWAIGFLLMWLVIGNLGVLPLPLLLFAIPLSLLEVIVAVYLIHVVNLRMIRKTNSHG